MKISKSKLLSGVFFTLAFIFVIGIYIKYYNEDTTEVAYLIKNVESNNKNTGIKEDNKIDESNSDNVEEVEVLDAIEEPIYVYEEYTMDSLAEQLNKSLASTLSDKGYLYAEYCLERGVDPFLAAAISLEETGCTWGCSDLVVTCNNVGGMKGSGCGAYAAFPTIDDGIKAFIDNIANNYVAYGLTTAELMNPKYAENPMWASNVNAYITRIKNK